MKEIAVKLENISKYYKLYNNPKERLKEALHPFKKKYHKEFYALNHINLEIKKGEILGVVGRNGAGKSTLLKLISGVIQPSSGTAQITGNVSALLELNAGLNPEFTGIQNIFFNGTMMGFTRKEMKEKIEDVVSFADIGDFIHQPLKTYSSGMKMRLGFALAVNIEPEILILDEVLAVGDELFRRKCYSKIEELFKAGCTVFYVSHSANSINQLCSRAILLDNGELILDGIPNFVTTHYQRLLYAMPESKKKIRDEIIQIKNETKKVEELAVNQGTNQIKSSAEMKKERQSDNKEHTQEAIFIDGFISKSTVEYKNYDVEINDINIKTMDGKKVNALVIDDEYIFTYKIKFNTFAEHVQTLMAFKTEKGFFISGGIAPGRNNFIDFAKEGDEYLVEWHFRCHLLTGNYYINISVKALKNEEKVFLNRIVDALAFKVQKKREQSYTGIVHLSQQSKIIELNTEFL